MTASDQLLRELRARCPYGAPEFIELTLDELDLHSRKNHDYAAGGDPLGNFDRVGRFVEMYPGLDPSDPTVYCLLMLMKQLDAVFWAKCQGFDAEVEGIDQRLRDVHVYAKIGRIIEARYGKGRLGSPNNTP